MIIMLKWDNTTAASDDDDNDDEGDSGWRGDDVWQFNTKHIRKARMSLKYDFFPSLKTMTYKIQKTKNYLKIFITHTQRKKKIKAKKNVIK